MCSHLIVSYIMTVKQVRLTSDNFMVIKMMTFHVGHWNDLSWSFSWWPSKVILTYIWPSNDIWVLIGQGNALLPRLQLQLHSNLLGLWHSLEYNPDSKVHGADMGPTWGQQDPGGPHVGPLYLIWEYNKKCSIYQLSKCLWKFDFQNYSHMPLGTLVKVVVIIGTLKNHETDVTKILLFPWVSACHISRISHTIWTNNGQII